jgi:hypothetical protein
MPSWSNQPWRRDSNETASGKPGAVHNEQTKEYASKAAGFENIARMAGMQLAYDNYYRALTTDSAHVLGTNEPLQRRACRTQELMLPPILPA